MRVLVRAYMAMNLGDDLFLDTLFRRFPNVSFEVESWFYDDYKKFVDNYSNASIRKKENFSVKLIRMKNQGFYSAIREKLMWGANGVNK